MIKPTKKRNNNRSENITQYFNKQNKHLLSAESVAQRGRGGKERKKDMEEKNCCTCKYSCTCKCSGVPKIGDPCKDCKTLERWEPKFIPDESPFPKVSAFSGEPVAPVVGFDPGAPEGDKTNVRQPWPLDGMEINPWLLRKPSDIIDDDENGPVFAITRMPLQMVIGYAIDGIKDHVSKLGLMLTDRSKTEKDLEDTIIELRGLHTDWDSLETEMEALRKAVEGAKHGSG